MANKDVIVLVWELLLPKSAYKRCGLLLIMNLNSHLRMAWNYDVTMLLVNRIIFNYLCVHSDITFAKNSTTNKRSDLDKHI